jgi:large subunit ribosomal protein L29
MKIDEIRGKTDDEIVFDLTAQKRTLFDLRFKAATETSASPARIRELRRAIARMHTILHERQSKIRGQEPR